MGLWLSHPNLEEGRALLEKVMAGESPDYRTVAQNLAATYSTRIYDCVRKLVETDRGLRETDLAHGIANRLLSPFTELA